MLMEPALSNGKTENPLDDNAIQALETAFQQDITNPKKETQGSRFKVVFVILLLLICGLGILYFASTLFTNNDQLPENNLVPTSNNAVAKIRGSNKEIKDLFGKVFTTNELGIDYQYELVKPNGEKLGYLASEKLDLSLVVGMTVFIDGTTNKMINEIPVIVVESVEFSK
ncbi:MAG: hypothetical protein QG570_332 [Patescibacteria group bacterium]|nr:hypothetical protein [Patescibacteria group bacterium]